MKKYIPYLLGAIIIMLLAHTCDQSRKHKRSESLRDQNVQALTDTLRIAQNKAGDQEASIAAFVTSERDLKDLNAELYAELQKERGKVAAIITTTVTVDHPLTMGSDLLDFGGGNYGLKFDTTDLHHSISGISKFARIGDTIFPGRTEITVNQTRIDLILGFTEEDKVYRVFARSPDPSVTISTLDGALIIQKPKAITVKQERKKRFGIGIQAGYGITTSGLSPYIGAGVQWNIVRF